jgi:hypothetical protein
MQFRLAILSFVVLAISACGVDITPGTQFAGQTCFADEDCRDGLICANRVCAPTSTGGQGATDAGSNNVAPDGGNDAGNNVTPDGGPPPIDFGNTDCMPGEVQCIDPARRAECIDTPEGPRFQSFACPADTFCEMGRCVGDFPCNDQDGDGYGDGCPAGPDCEDRVASVNPGGDESCATPFDDNCNGEAQEGCPTGGCCPNGCASDEFCSAQCVCQEFDGDLCEYQNQPCNTPDQFVNDLFCAPLGDELRCIGICDKTAPDPASTCPEPNSVCAFGDENSGVCLSGCDPDIGCGEPGLGCLPVTSSPLGVMCIPATNKQLGASCETDIFFDCAPGLLCVDVTGAGAGRCEEACRPFGTAQTDCSAGNFCLPLSLDIGICFQDNGATDGQSCVAEGTTCGDDAVGCYPAGFGGNRCQRLCRLAEGNADCPRGNCRQFSMDQTELGSCRAGMP